MGHRTSNGARSQISTTSCLAVVDIAVIGRKRNVVASYTPNKQSPVAQPTHEIQVCSVRCFGWEPRRPIWVRSWTMGLVARRHFPNPTISQQINKTTPPPTKCRRTRREALKRTIQNGDKQASKRINHNEKRWKLRCTHKVNHRKQEECTGAQPPSNLSVDAFAIAHRSRLIKPACFEKDDGLPFVFWRIRQLTFRCCPSC